MAIGLAASIAQKAFITICKPKKIIASRIIKELNMNLNPNGEMVAFFNFK